MRSLAAAAELPNVLLFNGGGGGIERRCGNNWDVSDSDALYRVGGWGSPYFFINTKGNLCVRSRGGGAVGDGDGDDGIELTAVVREATKRLATPLILRFPEIVEHRLRQLQGAFDRAMKERRYGARFQGVFPVKCNPDRFLVEDIVHYGREFGFGLEAGSKPELVMAMACMCKASRDALLICNGYKDAEYVRLALLARQLGINCVLVVEQQEEVDLIVQVMSSLNIEQQQEAESLAIGVRAKLSTKHGGHWGETSGENGKFGLSALEIVEIAQSLRRNGMLGCLQLLHFHVGSQIPSLGIVEESVSEAAHIFCDLKRMGGGMKYLDIGGGLGIDYDGSRSSDSDLSVGYSVEQYAVQVVAAVDAACSLKGVSEKPIIICESGRGLVSHHSVLVFDVFSACRRGRAAAAVPTKCEEAKVESLVTEAVELLPEELRVTVEQLGRLVKDGAFAAALEYARSLKAEICKLFKAGCATLEQRAAVERLAEALLRVVEQQQPRSVYKFEGKQPATYNMNLSMFKALPDSWAIGQLFPIMPLHRLDEEPTVAASLSDLTCDSDGQVRDFILSNAGAGSCYSKSLPVHSLVEGEPYYVGAFLVGAYQEALGSMHNLFGGMNVVHVVAGHQGFTLKREVPGQTVAAVLRLVQYDPWGLFDTLRSRLITSLHQGAFEDECEARMALQALARAFSSYTYLSSEKAAEDSDSVCSLMVHCC